MPITHRVARYIVDNKEEETKAGNKAPPEQLVVVLDTLVHLPRIHGLLVEIEDFDDEDVEPDFVDELKLVFDAALSSGLDHTFRPYTKLLRKMRHFQRQN